MDQAYTLHTAERKKLSDRNREYMNKSRMDPNFYIGQRVTLRNHDIAQIEGTGLQQKFHGIFNIVSINEIEKTCILQHIDDGSYRGAHLRHLNPLGPSNSNEYTIPIKNQAASLLNNKQHQVINEEEVTKRDFYNLRSRT